MQDIFGSVRRSLVFRTPNADGADDGNLVEKINSCIRNSRVFSKLSPPPRALPSPTTAVKDGGDAATLTIRWRKGEMIGCGAFGQVYMGMNLDSGELLAVKQVMIAANSASKEKAQRYLGIVREEDTLNILLEFVPGGSISSLLGKFGAFPEPVIRTYTKQLLLGLDYLHKNGIMHRDIKGANILVDNKGCIKLADFGASKKVVELATISGAKSMKGTPYWMAPEVIRQTGHSFSADIWSVGCTVIEMTTGKPPWSQQYQEVAALFYIGTTKAHPPIPEHVSVEAKDFLLKCLQKEPELRPSASELLQHPFVTGEAQLSLPDGSSSMMGKSQGHSYPSGHNAKSVAGSVDICNLGSLNISMENTDNLSEARNILRGNSSDDDMCQIDDNDNLLLDGGTTFSTVKTVDDFNKSFNPIAEPSDDWNCDYGMTPQSRQGNTDLVNNQEGGLRNTDLVNNQEGGLGAGSSDSPNNNSAVLCGPSISEDEDELTESKIRAFLDEKALELKKLQTPLYEEFYNSLNPSYSPQLVEATIDETTPNYLKLPPKSRSPSQGPIGSLSTGIDMITSPSPGSSNRRTSCIGSGSNQDYDDSSPQSNERRQSNSPIASFSEIQRKWKEELDQELERKREMMRQAGVGGKTSSPKDRALNRQRERSRFASPGK
ncbi:mitogen-activated protein kinase kinase kinase NPK1 isoform X3 [Solanum dulcamara]|uniref:mitogen-activated protein kinase kinase kinase NPK1 isoform X3 n=1 Tax=Solanum dulcamara TaxID=45834 RepID=UPI0024861549|nr:mitogen-activated protein kinase kinase kinase NPK1 isoform X3 [Solanum dulcamara]